MERQLLEQKMAEPAKVYNKQQIQNILQQSIISSMGDGNPMGHRQLIITTEELAELTQQVTKELRGKGDKLLLTEELADVLICTEYLKMICYISDEDLNKMIGIKLSRLEERVRTNTYK